MKYEIVYHPKVISDDIPKLSSVMKQRICRAVEQKLVAHPEFFGKPLHTSFKGYRKLRVGDYRVIFRIEKNFVKIFTIAHRSIVYSLSREI